MKKALIVLVLIVIIVLAIWWLGKGDTAQELDNTPIDTVENDTAFDGLDETAIDAEFDALDAEIEAL